MDGLGKGLAVAACAIAIVYAAVELKAPGCLWAFVPVAWIIEKWNCDCNDDD
ncbi:MAG: hypothetical protein ACXQT0_04745 [Candidatus Methanofastidiosia archaeon]